MTRVALLLPAFLLLAGLFVWLTDRPVEGQFTPSEAIVSITKTHKSISGFIVGHSSDIGNVVPITIGKGLHNTGVGSTSCTLIQNPSQSNASYCSFSFSGLQPSTTYNLRATDSDGDYIYYNNIVTLAAPTPTPTPTPTPLPCTATIGGG